MGMYNLINYLPCRWPSSIYEFNKVITPLIDPELNNGSEDEGFDVIIPSLPGHGWSEIPETPMDVKRVASVMVKLMESLEYYKYGACGGDWGGLVASYMAIEDPQHCCAIHLTSVIADWEPESIVKNIKMKVEYIFRYACRSGRSSCFRNALMTPHEVKVLEKLEQFEKEELGYMHIHSTKPQTVRYSKTGQQYRDLYWILSRHCSQRPAGRWLQWRDRIQYRSLLHIYLYIYTNINFLRLPTR
jgi:pimeloyl-ACP methyl ester carboxylesterase